MSNPGYPYGQGPYPPNSAPPYPPSYSAPYPPHNSPYPSHGGVYAPSLGFNAAAPMYMPQPYAGMGHPSSTSGGSYTPQYPTAPQCYPQYQNTTHSSYPNQNQSSYPQRPTYNHGNKIRVEYKGTPTVVPAHPFNPREDAEILRKAMKGIGTDEKAIINVVTRRSNAQRIEITSQFKTLFGKDLIKELKSELSGNFEKAVIALMTPLPQYYAKELHDAISGLGTDETVLIQVLCSLSNAEIRTIRNAYETEYHKNLEKDLIGDTSGHFKRLMVSLCSAGRDESMTTDHVKARADAQALYNAGVKKWGTDESTFNMVLCQRNIEQLKLIFQEYRQLAGHDIEEAIKKEFSGYIEDGLLAVIRAIKNQTEFFAKCLNKSMKGLGTRDRDLIRLIVTRCEIDMGEIKKEYAIHYKESLAAAIKGDTSGDYRKCLLALIGES